MTRTQKYLLSLGGCLFFYTLTGFVIIPMILTRVVPNKLQEQLHRPVTIEKIRLNPYALSLFVTHLTIKEADGTREFISLDTFYANLQLMSLFKRGLILKEIKVVAPHISVVRTSHATFNFSDLLTGNTDNTADAPQETDEPSRPFRFAVSDIQIMDGIFVYHDVPYDKTHTMDGINWKVPFISNFIKDQDTFSEPALACTVDGATLTLDVKTKPFKNTLETLVHLDLSGISLPTYAAYIPKDQVGIQVKSGTLGLGVGISFRQARDAHLVTVQGHASLSNLNVADENGRDILNLSGLNVSVRPSDVMNNQLHIGEIHLDSPFLAVVRDADETLNLLRVVKTPPPGPEETAPPQPGNSPKENTGPTAQDQPASPFLVDVDDVKLVNGTLRFTDHAAGVEGQAVETTITDLDIQVSSASNRPDTPASFDIKAALNHTASIALKGQFIADPVSVNCDLDLSGLDLTWGQPYLPPNIALVINKGLVAAMGHVDMTLPADGPMGLTVTGKTQIKAFSTVDPEKAESFLSWTDFTVDGVHVAMAPLQVFIDTISFKDLSNQVIVFKDGATNLEKIFMASNDKGTAEPETIEKTPQKEENADVIPIRIGKVVLSHTTLGVVDRSVSPPYSTRLNLNTLDVTGLTSEDFEAATVHADGNMDGYAPVKISGTVNPLSKDLFVDLAVRLSNVEMAPFSTYTGKYIGKAIEKGKLNLGVDYLIKDKAIKADNQIVLDQFTLGKDVKSPDAMNLPVGLAISLLKDRKGVIDIDMPVSGRTDDPEFKWGKTMLKALGNLITKAATSPFSLVASLVKGGEELQYIQFQPGKASLSEAEKEKLSSIHTLLVERPGLKLDILGYVDKQADRLALATLALERKIKADEIMKALKNGAPDTPETVFAIVQRPEDRDKALKNLYQKDILANPPDGHTPKPLNDPTLTDEDMVAALTQVIPVTKADLGLLAMTRAREVKSILLEDAEISPERIYLREPQTLTPPQEKGFKQSRVELGLK